MALSRADIQEILRIVDGAPVGELMVRTEGFTLHLIIGDESPGVGSPLAANPAQTPASAGSSEPRTQGASRAQARERPRTPDRADPPPAPGAGTAQPTPGTETISAPMLGTFYGAEAPGAAPFVEVGARVEPDTIVCIIEVMKMMNSVAAGVSGTVVEIAAENGALVEFGQPLFRVEPE
jgi:acetyl-CoA carboxylase biotin carboxyl carrier protein